MSTLLSLAVLSSCSGGQGATKRAHKSGDQISLPPCRAEQWRAGHGPGKKPLLMKRIDSGIRSRKGEFEDGDKGGIETWSVGEEEKKKKNS